MGGEKDAWQTNENKGKGERGAGRAEETKLSSVTLGFSEFPQHGAGVLTWITINVKVRWLRFRYACTTGIIHRRTVKRASLT